MIDYSYSDFCVWDGRPAPDALTCSDPCRDAMKRWRRRVAKETS